MEKEFALEDVLTVVTGRMITSRGMDGIYDVLGFMTGEDIYTHQIPGKCDICCPVLLNSFPELKEAVGTEQMLHLSELISKHEVAMDGVKEWISHVQKNYGLKPTYMIEQLGTAVTGPGVSQPFHDLPEKFKNGDAPVIVVGKTEPPTKRPRASRKKVT